MGQNSINKIYEGNSETCSDQARTAELLCEVGSDCTSASTAYAISAGSGTAQFQFTSSSNVEVFFIVEHCDVSASQDIDLNPYSISSSSAIECSVLRDGESQASYVVAVIFLVLMLIGLATATFVFYRRKVQLESIQI